MRSIDDLKWIPENATGPALNIDSENGALIATPPQVEGVA